MATMTRRIAAAGLALAALLVGAGPALAETTLEKIGRTGTLMIGTRTGSPPFAFVNKQNEWVGFSIDLVEARARERREEAAASRSRSRRRSRRRPRASRC